MTEVEELPDGWVRVKITPQMIDRAKSIEDQRGIVSRMNNWQTQFKIHNWIGILGEWAFKMLLDYYWVHYDHDDRIDQPDEFDFMIDGKIIDVKTAQCNFDLEHDEVPSHYKFQINEVQVQRHQNVDIYLHIQIDPNLEWAYIIGWIEGSRARKYVTREVGDNITPVARIGFRALKPVMPYLTKQNIFADSIYRVENWLKTDEAKIIAQQIEDYLRRYPYD